MDPTNTLCQQLGQILKGKAHTEDGVCMVEHSRKNINAKIMGMPFHSLSHMFNFELGGENTPALITAELVLLENEVPYANKFLLEQGITVGAVHNHWLSDNPKLMYIHFQVIMRPLDFAQRMTPLLQFIG